MIEYWKNLSLESLFYISEDGLIRQEEWKDVPKHEGHYMMSTLGRLWSLDRKDNIGRRIKPKIRKPSLDKDGYVKYHITTGKISDTIKSHQTMGVIFLGHKPDGVNKIVDHKNNIKLDNRLENLQIITQRENSSKDRSPKSGATGVIFLGKKFQANIGYNKKSISLGVFCTIKEAEDKYKEAVFRIENNLPIDDIIVRSSSFTGVKGVSKASRSNKFRAYKYELGNQVYIGTFDTIEEAEKAYKDSFNSKY